MTLNKFQGKEIPVNAFLLMMTASFFGCLAAGVVWWFMASMLEGGDE